MNTNIKQFDKKWLTLFAVLFLLIGCGGGGGGSGSEGTPDNATFDKKAVLKDIAAVVVKDLQLLDTDTASFKSDLITYCDQPLDQAKKEKSRASYKKMMYSLQRVLPYTFSPLEIKKKFVSVYSWPKSNACRLDIKLAKKDYAIGGSPDSKGVDALEYLHFVEGNAGHTCLDATVATNPELTAFNALPVAEKQQRRCDLMKVLVEDVSQNVSKINSFWMPSGENYQSTFSESSDPDSMLNKVTDAFFYLEGMIKESKLDRPLGGNLTNYPPSCGSGQICIQDSESPHAKVSKENIIANIEGLQHLYYAGAKDTAANQTGFDDWLSNIDEDNLSKKMENRMQAIIDGLNNIEGSFVDALSTNPQPFNELLSGPVQNLSQTLKFQFPQAFGFTPPAGAISDTD